MSNLSWSIATLLMLALGVFFIANHHARDHAAGLAITEEINPSVSEAGK